MHKLVKQQLPIEKIKRLVELDKAYDAIKEERDQLRADLLAATQALDVISLKTGKYTIYRSKRLTPHVISFKTLKDSLEEANIPYQTEETFIPQMMVVFRELTKQGKTLKGLDVNETEYISIRVNDKPKEVEK